jgi:hypothetical protein
VHIFCLRFKKDFNSKNIEVQRILKLLFINNSGITINKSILIYKITFFYTFRLYEKDIGFENVHDIFSCSLKDYYYS